MPVYEHTKGPWKPAKCGGAVVAYYPVIGGPGGCDEVEHYDGHLIAESIAPRNVPIVSAAPSMYNALKSAEVMLRVISGIIPNTSTNDNGNYRNVSLHGVLKEVQDAIARVEVH